MEIDHLPEEERQRRLEITFKSLEAFEREALEIESSPRPAGVDPVIRQAQIDASRSVARDLRAEATLLAGGRYICTKVEPWSEEKGRACHPAAEDAGECSWFVSMDITAQHYRCPYCGVHWTVEHDG